MAEILSTFVLSQDNTSLRVEQGTRDPVTLTSTGPPAQQERSQDIHIEPTFLGGSSQKRSIASRRPSLPIPPEHNNRTVGCGKSSEESIHHQPAPLGQTPLPLGNANILSQVDTSHQEACVQDISANAFKGHSGFGPNISTHTAVSANPPKGHSPDAIYRCESIECGRRFSTVHEIPNPTKVFFLTMSSIRHIAGHNFEKFPIGGYQCKFVACALIYIRARHLHDYLVTI